MFFFQLFSMAGLFAGLTEAVVINPFEVVKVKLQAERSVYSKVGHHLNMIIIIIISIHIDRLWGLYA